MNQIWLAFFFFFLTTLTTDSCQLCFSSRIHVAVSVLIKLIRITFQALLTAKPFGSERGGREKGWFVQQWSKSDMRINRVKLENNCFLCLPLPHYLWSCKRPRRWHRDSCHKLHFATRKFNGAKILWLCRGGTVQFIVS